MTLPPADVVYLRCAVCAEVTSHSTIRDIPVPLTGSEMLPQQLVPVAVLQETVCDICDQAQPRSLNDAVEGDVYYACTGRIGWYGVIRWRCGHLFRAPAAAPWPRCPRCGAVQRSAPS